jgi:hypothetical protein
MFFSDTGYGATLPTSTLRPFNQRKILQPIPSLTGRFVSLLVTKDLEHIDNVYPAGH